MILPLLRKVAADSNVILSATIGKAALKVFTQGRLEMITTDFNCSEVREYLPVLAEKHKLNLQILMLQFEMLPLRVYPFGYYKNLMMKALKMIKDPDDAHLLALAMKDDVPVWSNDEDFYMKSIQRFTTAELLKIIE